MRSSLLHATLALLLVGSSTLRASAQDRPSEPDDPETADRDQAAGGSAEPADAASNEADRTLAEARERQARARALLEGGDANGALAEYERVYRLLDGHARQHIVLANIGRCYQALQQYDRAMTYYERFLAQSPPNAVGRVEARAAIDALGALLGAVSVSTNVPEAEVWVDDRRLGTAPGTFRVPGGRHVVELRAAGRSPARSEIDVAARETVEVDLHLERLGDGSGIDPAFFWSGLILTLAAGAAGLAVGGAWLARRQENEDLIDAGTVTTMDVDAERGLALAADVVYASTGAFAIATVILAFVTQWDDPAADTPTARLELAGGPGQVNLRLQGTFE